MVNVNLQFYRMKNHLDDGSLGMAEGGYFYYEIEVELSTHCGWHYSLSGEPLTAEIRQRELHNSIASRCFLKNIYFCISVYHVRAWYRSEKCIGSS